MNPTPRPFRRPTSDERRFLDMLCFLRALYAGRGPTDSVAVASVAASIDAAELRMRILRTHDTRMLRRFGGG